MTNTACSIIVFAAFMAFLSIVSVVFRIPGRSYKLIASPSHITLAPTASRVTPGWSNTIDVSCAVIAFINVLFPVLASPKITTAGG